MLGTWRWNAGLGIMGAAMTILFSIGSNPMSTMLFRSLYAFLAFFVLAYVARAVLGFILRPPSILPSEELGAQLDMTTPDDPGELNDLLKSQLQGKTEASGENGEKDNNNFRPLAPPQLVSTNNKKPDQLANALRHLTGE